MREERAGDFHETHRIRLQSAYLFGQAKSPGVPRRIVTAFQHCFFALPGSEYFGNPSKERLKAGNDKRMTRL